MLCVDDASGKVRAILFACPVFCDFRKINKKQNWQHTYYCVLFIDDRNFGSVKINVCMKSQNVRVLQ